MRSTRSPGRRCAALTTALAVGAGLMAGGAAPAVAAPADGVPEPALRYSMSDVSGTTVPDSSGNSRNGTISGSTAVVAGEDGDALDLTGGHVVIPRDAIAGATDLTVSTRVRWDGGANWQWLYGLGANQSRYLFATPSGGDGRLRTSITANGAGGEARVIAGEKLRAGEWATLTTTLDTAADRLTTYIDGVAVSSSPTTVTASQLVEGAQNAGAIGRSFYPDPAFDGAVDDFQIFHSALTDAQVAELATGDEPTVQTVTETRFTLRTTVGNPVALPERALASFSDGYTRGVPVVWEPVPAERYASSKRFDVRGDAAGTPVTAQVTVSRGEVRIDLGSDTGDVYGGASGVLYGLYDEGMPTNNLIEGMDLRTVATKAQDGAQHPGSDALEVLPQIAETTGGDIYLRITDWYRGFPYQWPGNTPEARLNDYKRVLDEQLVMIEEYAARGEDEARHVRENLVIEPWNEPEGNSFGSGAWSYNNVSWLDNPTDYFAAWDYTYTRIKAAFPEMRIAGPGTSYLFDQNEGWLEHVVANDTVPDIITWHELTHPQAVRDSIDKFRGWEREHFAGTKWEGMQLPININEYAFNYHTSVPGQMIQWMSAIEEKKVDAMIAFWNINGNLSDSAVQSNRANGQWWLYNSYAQMTGHTVELTPPSPGVNYTLQGVASLDEERKVSRAIIGGANGTAPVDFVNVPEDVFGDRVLVTAKEIAWTGQLGDSAEPETLAQLSLPVTDGTVTLDFDGTTLPQLKEASAYEITVTPAGSADGDVVSDTWHGNFEAEAARYTGAGYSRNGPEGSPSNVAKFYTSGGFNVGGLRTGSNGKLDFTVDVPADGTYDLSVFANSLNTFNRVQEQGPTNVFLTVDGGAEQELFLPLAYKWVVWDKTDTRVDLTAGQHTISLAARSLDGSRATIGDAIIDRITLVRDATEGPSVYEAELADHEGAAVFPTDGALSGAGAVQLAAGESATFWVYGAEDAEATVAALGSGTATVAINGFDATTVGAEAASVHLQGGVNKVTVTAGTGGALIDAITVADGSGRIGATEYQAEAATRAGSAAVVDLSLAEGAKAVSGIGGDPGNGNTVTFEVQAAEAGPHAVVVRYSNPEQVPATHYNPNPMARHADISVNGGAAQQVMFPPTFHRNNFWERTVVLDLRAGANSIRFAAEEEPNFDGETYAQENWPGIPLRAKEAPILDRITVSPLKAATVAPSVSFESSAQLRCLPNKRVALAVRADNTDDVPLRIEFASAHGSRTFSSVPADRSATHTFTIRAGSAPAGEVVVTATGPVDGQQVTTTQKVAYPALACS